MHCLPQGQNCQSGGDRGHVRKENAGPEIMRKIKLGDVSQQTENK